MSRKAPEVEPFDISFDYDYNALTTEEWNASAQVVSEAIEIFRNQDEENLEAIAHKLFTVPKQGVVQELFWRVTDYFNAVDAELFEQSNLPLPANTQEIVIAILTKDVDLLKEASATNMLSDLYTSLLLIAAALKDAVPAKIK